MGKKLSKTVRFDSSHKPRKVQRPPQLLVLIQCTPTKKPLQFLHCKGLTFSGGPDGARTRDPLRDRQVF